MTHYFHLGPHTNNGCKGSLLITQNVLETLLPYPSSLIWVVTYSKVDCRATASLAAAGTKLFFKCFLANTNTSSAFAAWQVANR